MAIRKLISGVSRDNDIMAASGNNNNQEGGKPEKDSTRRQFEDEMSKTSQDDDVQFIASLVDILRERELSELEVERRTGAERKLKVKIGRKGIFQPVRPLIPPAQANPFSGPARREGPPTDAAKDSVDPAQHPGVVTSPMVGLVYLQPEEGAPKFVELGQKVSEGQTLLIIEAMKTMNNINAPRSGTITRILVDNMSPVEFGSPLLTIE